MHNPGDDINDLYSISFTRTSGRDIGVILGEQTQTTEITYSRLPWVWDKLPHRAQWYYNGSTIDSQRSVLISQEDWYGHEIKNKIVESNVDRSQLYPDLDTYTTWEYFYDFSENLRSNSHFYDFINLEEHMAGEVLIHKSFPN